MNIGERIKKLRKEKKLTQQVFADRLCLKRQTIASYEAGIIAPSDRTITDICREFNASECWLRTGDGEMFMNKSINEELSGLFANVLTGDVEFKRSLLAVLLRMEPEEWKFVERKAWELAEEMKKALHPTETDEEITPDAPETDDNGLTAPVSGAVEQEQAKLDIAAELAELKRQNQEKDRLLQELAAKVAAMEKAKI